MSIESQANLAHATELLQLVESSKSSDPAIILQLAELYIDLAKLEQLSCINNNTELIARWLSKLNAKLPDPPYEDPFTTSARPLGDY